MKIRLDRWKVIFTTPQVVVFRKKKPLMAQNDLYVVVKNGRSRGPYMRKDALVEAGVLSFQESL